MLNRIRARCGASRAGEERGSEYPDGMGKNARARLERSRTSRDRMTYPSALPLYKVAYEEGKRQVDDQVAELDGMRQRSVQFLAFVGAATGFLVGTSLHRVGTTTPGPAYGHLAFGLAVAASLASLIAIFLVLSVLLGLSRKGWRMRRAEFEFRLSSEDLLDLIEADVGKPDEVDFYKYLASEYDVMYDTNDSYLVKIRRYYTLFIAIGFIQLALWTAVAWING
jgi:hypothetical protein